MPVIKYALCLFEMFVVLAKLRAAAAREKTEARCTLLIVSTLIAIICF